MSVGPEKVKELAEQMKKAGLLEADLEEKFIRSGGSGGQNVNKTATCVYLKHRPSGLEVKMQKERSQHANRFFARRVMLEKFEIWQRDHGGMPLGMPPFKTASELKREKIRKQKNRRARRSGTGF